MSSKLHLAQHFGKHFRQVYLGGNWSDNCIADHLSGLSLEEATRSVAGSNSIAAIAYHLHYFVNGILQVLIGKSLNTSDDPSWNTPRFSTQQQWDDFVNLMLQEAEQLAQQLEALPEGDIWLHFYDPKFSSIFTNSLGILEHSYYHLGQIAILRRIQSAKQI